MTSARHSSVVGSDRGGFARLIDALNETLDRNTAPSTMNMITTGIKMPKKFAEDEFAPADRFHSNVNAVRPSISSAIDPLAVHRARKIDNTMIKVRPSSLTILMSSPSVL